MALIIAPHFFHLRESGGLCQSPPVISLDERKRLVRTEGIGEAL